LACLLRAGDSVRILYVCGDIGIEVGGRKGAATHVRETCRALRHAGHEVLLLAAAIGDARGVETNYCEVKPPSSRLIGADGRYLLLNWRMGRALEQAYHDFQPEAVYERYSLYQTAGLDFCRWHGLPRILEVNTLLAEEQRHRLRLPFLAKRLESRLWRAERAIICVSTELKRRMIASAGLDESRMVGFEVAPVSISTDEFRPGLLPADLGRLGLPDKKVAGYMGTLTAWHGVDIFFEVARIARDRDLPFVVAAFGGEPERVARLRQRVAAEGLAQHLFFLGSVPHTDVPAYLAAMDVCLIPDTQDWSSPTKFFEFAAMEKPIVAARRPSVEEVLGDGEPTGLLFERGNAQAMVDAIMRFLDDPSFAREAGRAARRRVVSRYSWPCNVRRILRLFAAQGSQPAAHALAALDQPPLPAEACQ
jgi:glycosyltransferase involved in cell wall biosynthesis